MSYTKTMEILRGVTNKPPRFTLSRRLRSNRAALGIDGSLPRATNPNNSYTAQPSPNSKPFTHDFSDDMLEKELKRLALKRERMFLDDAVVNQYENKWESFTKIVSANGEEEQLIKLIDVPFLPTFEDSNNKTKRVDWRIVGEKERSSYSQKKAALRKATMRFHPDQFFNKFANRIDPSEIDKIMQGVKECAQRLNELRKRLEMEKEEDELDNMDFSFTPKPKATKAANDFSPVKEHKRM